MVLSNSNVVLSKLTIPLKWITDTKNQSKSADRILIH